MDKTHLFKALADEAPSVLLDLLSRAYDAMKVEQRRDVFAQYVKPLPPEPPEPVDGEMLLDEIEIFQKASLAGHYYAPFNINSKNFMHTPEETDTWFEELDTYLKASRQLTLQGDHAHAVTCFGALYDLIDAMERGEEIVFGDEIGCWMIPGSEREYIAAYMTSLAATMDPEAFTEAAIPLIWRDSLHSLYARAYESAINAADGEQRAHLDAEIQRQEIRTEPRW
jgi:hypothetical protein